VRSLERLAVWKEDILLGSLGDVIKMWIVLGFHTGSEEVYLLSKRGITGAANDGAQN
jgi:hypothetical protein